jgi:glutathione peroxidase
MRTLVLSALALPILVGGIVAANPPAGDAKPEVKPAPASPKDDPVTKDPAYVLGFTMKSIDGKDVDLSQYRGKVVLMVNVASQCGLTGQYKALEKLYKDKKDAGLVIIGLPANNFGSQEPGTNEEIATFCKSKYDVTFPMMAKISVKGDDQHALYKKLTGQPAPIGGEVKWNFQKYLVSREGKVIKMFAPTVTPDDKDLVKQVNEALAAGEKPKTDKPADTKPAK